MSKAANKLDRLLARDGPMTVAQFMGFCLADPEVGYYLTQHPFGRHGDFITAPEVSQMFGELLGAWCAHCYHSAGRPDVCNIVELGPGRGTLMADLMRSAGADHGFAQSIAVHLVEISPALRQQQAQTLDGLDVQWHDDVRTLPAGFTLIVANEFFDALPIQQFVYRQSHWHERLVRLD